MTDIEKSSTDEERVIRRGFGLKAEIMSKLNADYHSSIVETIRDNGGEWQIGELQFRLATAFGFCYGVDKAVDFAYETRHRFPERRIFLTNEIIHNPRVNARLAEIGIEFLSEKQDEAMDLSELSPEDVVLIPAFGVPVALLERLKQIGCILVDTTCGSVVHVWKRVERYAREGFTSVVHGKYSHEETQATCSYAMGDDGQGKYLVLRDFAEAEEICSFIRHGGDSEALNKKYAKASSQDFDFATDLTHIGLANQTTMLSSESMQIANMLREALTERYGPDALAEHFRSFDTICNATQERQDAVLALMEEPPDLMLVVGGFNSSNTGHLCEIASQHCPAYHINDVSAMLSPERIEHKPAFAQTPITSEDWLPAKRPLRIGLTSGASTPNKVLGEVIERLAEWQEQGRLSAIASEL